MEFRPTYYFQSITSTAMIVHPLHYIEMYTCVVLTLIYFQKQKPTIFNLNDQ